MSQEKIWIERFFANKIVLALLLLAVCGPYMLTRDIKFTKITYEFVTTVASLFIIGIYVRYGRFSTGVKCLALYMGWTYSVTFFISHNIASFYQVFLPIIAMVLWIELAFQYKGTGLLEAAAVFRIYIYVNLLLIFIFPAGLTGESRWLLGYRNMQAWAILPIMTVLILRSLWKYGKLDKMTWVDVIACIFTVSWIKSATSLVGLIVYLLVAGLALVCSKRSRAMPKSINLFDGWIVSFLFFFGIVIGRLQQVFSPLIVQVLHKDITFTGRTEIWDLTLEYLKKHFLTGSGYLTRSDFHEMFPSDLFSYVHPHNFILSLLLQGGVILLVIFVIWTGISGMQLIKSRRYLSANLLLALLLAFLVTGLTEALAVYMCPFLYPMLTLGMHSEELAVLTGQKQENMT